MLQKTNKIWGQISITNEDQKHLFKLWFFFVALFVSRLKKLITSLVGFFVAFTVQNIADRREKNTAH